MYNNRQKAQFNFPQPPNYVNQSAGAGRAFQGWQNQWLSSPNNFVTKGANGGPIQNWGAQRSPNNNYVTSRGQEQFNLPLPSQRNEYVTQNGKGMSVETSPINNYFTPRDEYDFSGGVPRNEFVTQNGSGMSVDADPTVDHGDLFNFPWEKSRNEYVTQDGSGMLEANPIAAAVVKDKIAAAAVENNSTSPLIPKVDGGTNNVFSSEYSVTPKPTATSLTQGPFLSDDIHSLGNYDKIGADKYSLLSEESKFEVPDFTKDPASTGSGAGFWGSASLADYASLAGVGVGAYMGKQKMDLAREQFNFSKQAYADRKKVADAEYARLTRARANA